MTTERRAVKVSIFGSEYTIRGEADEEYILSLARMVDEKMREISQGTNLSSSLKISVLAAINLADELSRLRSRQNGKWVGLENDPAGPSGLAPEAMSALVEHIESALKEE